jgi:hypothetical protein
MTGMRDSRSPGAAEGAVPPSADKEAAARRGWGRALRGALGVAGVGLLLGEAVSFLVFAGGGVPGLGAADAARGGILLFLLFHHVGFGAQMSSLQLPHHAEVPLAMPAGYAVDAVVGLALVGGTALLLWLLVRAGAAVAGVTGGRPRDRGLRGMQVAVPYALVTWGLAWLVHARVHFPGMPPVTVHASHVASLGWPLLLGAVAGFVGGLRSGPDGAWHSEWWESDRWGRRWEGAFAGATRTLVVGVALALAGVVVVGVVRIGDTAQYAADAFAGGPVAGLGVAVLAVLALPNAALWALAPAFGGCVQMTSGFGTGPYCILSYTHAPSHQLAARDIYWGLPQLGPPPAAFWLFLLVPVVAVAAGAVHGVRKAGAGGRREGALVAGMTGLVFTGMLLAVLVLSIVTVRFKGPVSYAGSGYLRYGPQPFDAIELGVGWGLGGLVVGWVAGWRRERHRGEACSAGAARAPAAGFTRPARASPRRRSP